MSQATLTTQLPTAGRESCFAPPAARADGLAIVRTSQPVQRKPFHLNPTDPLSDTRPFILAASWMHQQKLAEMKWKTGISGKVEPADIKVSGFRYWRGNFFEFDQCVYRRVQPDDLWSRLHGFLNGNTYYGAGGKLLALRVDNALTKNVIGQLRGICNPTGTENMPAWVGNENNETSRPCPSKVIAFNNGILDLDAWLADPSGQDQSVWFRDPTPEWFSENVLPMDFDSAAQHPRRWLAFLNQLWPDSPQSIEALQMWFGYCLVADTRQHKALMIVGPKRSGKGTICRILRRLLGEANVCGPTLSGLAGPFGMWSLIGKMLAIVSDARLSGRADQSIIVERLLALTGEDAITIDRKNLEPLTVQLMTRLVLVSNELPKLNDASGALASRFIILELQKSFFGTEDLNLETDLAAEMPSIFNWSLEGWRKLAYSGKLLIPASSVDAVDQMADLASPLKAFIRDYCVLGGSEETGVDDLYSGWCCWCESEGRPAGNKAVFGRDLRAAESKVHCTNNRTTVGRERKYHGIRLSATGETEKSIWVASRDKKRTGGAS